VSKKITNIFLVLASITLAVVLCEVGLRLLGIEYPTFWEYDPILGSKLRPGTKGYWLQEGGGYVSINSDGLRDREHSLEKPPNTFRIAVLGDSFTEALQVNQEDTFWAVMERDLQGCTRLGGRRVEVINFGHSGYGTSQELLALRHRVWKYSPDAVLLAFVTSNDVVDNFKPLAIQRGSWNDIYPYFRYQNGKLVLDTKPPEEWYTKNLQGSQETQSQWFLFSNRLKNSLRIFQLLRHFQKQAKADPIPANIVFGMYQEPSDELWKEAWNITENVLLLMRDEIAQKGAKFYVVVLTNADQVHPDPSVKTKYVQQYGKHDLFYPDRRIEKFCHQEGIPVLLLAPLFQEYANANQVYLHGFKSTFRSSDNLGEGHWNQAGHRLAGENIATWLCGQIN
jgi:hypothetical protein